MIVRPYTTKMSENFFS